MKWFEYDQNNSGGSFNSDLGYNLWIEAPTARQANAIAKDCGVYFNGCEQGIDCYFCGDRWHPAYGEGEDAPGNSQYAGSWGLETKVKPFGEGVTSYSEFSAREAKP
jgi:hypothetical protein